MVSDQEPRYRLVDSDGNIVGSLYGKPDGSVAIQETDSGSDREATLAPDGTFSAPSVETESVSTEGLRVKRGIQGELIDSFFDGERSTDLNAVIDVSDGDYRIYRVDIVAGGLGGSINLRLNGVSTNDYQYTQKNRSERRRVQDDDKFEIIGSSQRVTVGSITVRGDFEDGDYPDGIASFDGLTITSTLNPNESVQSGYVCDGGQLEDAERNRVDEIEIFGDSATLYAEVYGVSAYGV